MKIKEIIREGEEIPAGFGISYWSSSPPYWHSVCHRIPLNVIVRIGYLAWLWLLYPFANREPKYFWQGYQAAKKEKMIADTQARFDKMTYSDEQPVHPGVCNPIKESS